MGETWEHTGRVKQAIDSGPGLDVGELDSALELVFALLHLRDALDNACPEGSGSRAT